VNKIAENAENFAHAGRRYCSTVDSAPKYERAEFLLEIYRILPVLIGEAMGLPDAELPKASGNSKEPSSRMPYEAWAELYESLKEKFDDWNEYKKVFDPTSDNTEPIYGSLADDIADIYRDVQVGLLLRDVKQACWEEVVLDWRLGFYSHWGKHAIDALEVIHCRLSRSLM
jgi:hypothetical protein